MEGLTAFISIVYTFVDMHSSSCIFQWGVTLLADNYKCDSYFYLITVHTGMVRGAGTKSNIHFCIAGEDNDTGVRILSDGVRKVGFVKSLTVHRYYVA